MLKHHGRRKLKEAHAQARGTGASARGISPQLLLAQVRNTAPWLVDAPLNAFAKAIPCAAVLADVDAAEVAWKKNSDAAGYLRFLIAAHFATVATFVPTDVDQRIRDIAWKSTKAEQLQSVVDAVLALTDWPIAPLTERGVTVDKDYVAGHHGEWFSILAGALGRAIEVECEASIVKCTEWLDAELAREAAMFKRAVKQGEAQTILSLCTVLAHNVGDLSRVVDSWAESAQAIELAAKYTRLGHEKSAVFGDALARAGALNKAKMAAENHRFLPLRTPRALRTSRDLLLPIGPYFDGWGSMIAQHPSHDERDLAEVALALCLLHERSPREHGCLRALSGIDRVTPGGLGALMKLMPADKRALGLQGGVRQAMRTTEASFLETFHKDVKELLKSY
jgi:hypothetical protein